MEFNNNGLEKRKLGSLGLEVSALGLGTMMMPDNEDSIRTIHGALDQGVNFSIQRIYTGNISCNKDYSEVTSNW